MTNFVTIHLAPNIGNELLQTGHVISFVQDYLICHHGVQN